MGEKTKNLTKKPKSKKKKKIFVEHKPIVIGGIVAVVAIAGIVSGIVLFTEEEKTGGDFIFGTAGALYVLDPLLFGSFETYAILENIAEPLFDYDFTSSSSSVIPNLVIDYEWSNNGLNLTCYLRKNVKFHDGTPFNATAVKWNFDRLYRLRDYIYFAMWLHPDGTPLLKFNETEVLDEYTIRFILNKPFVPLISLLGRGPNIVSPTSTPPNNFTDFNTGNLVGTGPFKHNSTIRIWNPDLGYYVYYNTTLLPNRDYWGKKPKFDKIIIKSFDNHTLRKEAMINGEIHFTYSNPFEPDVYKNATAVTLLEQIHTEINFITMDNSVINATMRKAISYALDYDRLIPYGKYFTGGTVNATRCKSPLSKGMLYSDWESFKIPELNITKARQVLIDAKWSGTESLTANNIVGSGNDWEALVDDGNPLATYNFTYIVGSEWRTEVAWLFHNNLTQIGIDIRPVAATWPTYFTIPTQFIPIGWIPDYNDPNNNIQGIFSNTSFSNYGNINDAYLQQLMEDAVEETNEVLRAQLYYDIQQYLIEELYPLIWWYSPIISSPISLRIKGYNQYNNWKLAWKEWFFA